MINHAIDKIIEHNNQEGIAHQDKYRVGIGGIRKMTRRGDGVIRRVLNSREDEINQHHQTHQLGEYHNSKGNSGPSIEFVIPLDPNFNL
jgi:galactokinase/mevalonate kinase-like predicted kinase